MGTSSAYGGPKNGLVPDWVDDGDIAGDGSPSDNEGTNDDDTGDVAGESDTKPDTAKPSPLAIPVPTVSSARGSYTRFTNSGKMSALSKAVSNYAGSAGGSAGLTRRMPNSVRTASGVASLALGISNVGATETLKRFNLESLAGRPAIEVFEVLMDELCPAGGTIDEAVARDAYIEALDVMAQQDLGNFDELTPDQLTEFLAEVMTGSIVSKVINEVGTNSLHGSANDNLYVTAEAVLRDYTSGAVRDELARSFDNTKSVTSERMNSLMSEIFTDSFDVLQAMLEVAK